MMKEATFKTAMNVLFVRTGILRVLYFLGGLVTLLVTYLAFNDAYVSGANVINILVGVVFLYGVYVCSRGYSLSKHYYGFIKFLIKVNRKEGIAFKDILKQTCDEREYASFMTALHRIGEYIEENNNDG